MCIFYTFKEGEKLWLSTLLLQGPLIVQNSKGVKQLRAFTTLDELRSKISSACVPTRLTPLEVCKLMNALCSSSKACILGIDGMQFDWERVGGKIQSVSVAASFVQQFLACTSSVEEDRVLRSVLKTPTLNFTLGQKQEDFVDTVDGLPMLFLVEDMAMEVCKDSDLATIPASFMNVSDEAADGCAIVFDVQNGQVNRYVAVDAERVRRLTHKEMQ